VTEGEAPGESQLRSIAALRPGLATACGSLPHTDPAAAAELVLDALGDCPAAPTLPNHHPAEGMLGQAVHGMEGVALAPDGTLVVTDPDGVDPEAPGIGDDLPAEAFGATLAFLDAVAFLDADRRPSAVKLQCTGPVTLANALVAAGVPPRRAQPAANAAARRRARALVAAARDRLPAGTPLLFVVDEPSLGAATTGRSPIGPEEAVDLVSGTLAAVEAHAVAGVHCCAPADWSMVLRAGPALLSVPVEVATTLRAADLGPFLEDGGWVAWGAVPTDGPLGPLDGDDQRPSVARLWRHLADRWHNLADGGVDPVLLRQRALVTPACGLARHDEAQAALALRLTAALGERIAAGTARAGHRISG
jgi:methionine synthase II (cobalamin-independent)